MIILSIDPGTECSAWCLFETHDNKLVRFGQCPNAEVLAAIDETGAKRLIVEMFRSYGNVMGDTVLQTCVWIGRFVQEWETKTGLPFELIPRKTVVTQICQNPRANDSNVRQALLDRFGRGQGKRVAVGTIAAPGPLFGVKNDIWSALAIAVSWSEMREDLEQKLK
jgi:hypothetical protein